VENADAEAGQNAPLTKRASGCENVEAAVLQIFTNKGAIGSDGILQV
jgi:hypothetical protein